LRTYEIKVSGGDDRKAAAVIVREVILLSDYGSTDSCMD
jgi:hypothetical protein